MKYPTITAVMVTKGRLSFVQDSYSDFKRQIYPNKKMLIVTDCDDKEHNALKAMVRNDKELMVLHIAETKTLGELRNISIEYAPSDLSNQWDDDDRYGPDRMMRQWKGLAGNKACLLTEQLHYFKDTGEIAWTVDRSGIEGTILFDRRCGLHYPSERRGEDTVLKKKLQQLNMLELTPGGTCYCRTYHGNNTWDREHHIKRILQLGKNEKQLDIRKLQAAAKVYPWANNWKPLYGKGV